MEPPKISTIHDLSLDQACNEYIDLLRHPAPEHGWSRAVQQKIEDRLLLLQKIITEHIIKEKQNE